MGQRGRAALEQKYDRSIACAAGEFVYFDAGGVAQVAPITRLFATGGRVAVRAPRS